MIVRQILNDPDAVMACFDFFNDATDTLLWLKSLRNGQADKIAERLNIAFRNWLDRVQLAE